MQDCINIKVTELLKTFEKQSEQFGIMDNNH